MIKTSDELNLHVFLCRNYILRIDHDFTGSGNGEDEEFQNG